MGGQDISTIGDFNPHECGDTNRIKYGQIEYDPAGRIIPRLVGSSILNFFNSNLNVSDLKYNFLEKIIVGSTVSPFKTRDTGTRFTICQPSKIDLKCTFG
jgi:hypothetical protein